MSELAPQPDPLADLVGRYARGRGPFDTTACAARFGLGVAVVDQQLRRLAATGQLVSGEFTPDAVGPQWCDAGVLRRLRRRSLAALRREIEPVPPGALADFLPRWHQVGAGATGVEAVAAAVEQLQGVPVPASAWERLLLPARVADYSPAQLDELCAGGEVVWAGAGAIGGSDGWLTLCYADAAPLLLPPTDDSLALGPTHRAVLAALDGGQALFFRALADRVAAHGEELTDQSLLATVWELVWAGYLSNDTLAPVRALLAGGGGAHRRRAAPSRGRHHRPGRFSRAALAGAGPARGGPPQAAGRWYALPPRDEDPTRRATALAEMLLDRHGVVTRGAVAAEGPPGGFAGVYPVLAALEERGAARRGYFVEGLGAAQFAVPGAVDQLRARAPSEPAPARARPGGPARVVAATDPANPYGAALPWPERPADDPGATGHRAGRKAGALVVLAAGALVLYVERGGRSLLSYSDDPPTLAAAARALADAVHAGALGSLSVERADGAAVHASPLRDALSAAGFRVTPRGLRLRG